MFSQRSQVPRLPGDRPHGEPASPLPIWQRSLCGTGAGEMGRPGAQAAAKAGHLLSLRSWELPGSCQAVGLGQPCAPGALRLRSGKQREPDLVATHSGGCQGAE